ncbi:MAG: glutamyl-tRNA reductase [Candidatus Nanopelagicales bacterium]
MSLLVVGLSHRTAPVPLLERVAFDDDAQAKLLHDAVDAVHVAEAVVLSTCNRVEVYADVEKFHPGVAEISELVSRHRAVGLDELAPHLYVHYEDRAVQHLFTVTCGLDSMVVGESQILGQVKVALRAAQKAGAAGRRLNDLLQHALRVGKRAHTETGIDRAGASLVSVGLELSERALGGLAQRHALVVGAGSMSALTTHSLARSGIGRITVVNRTYAHAQRLAAAVNGTVVVDARPFDELSAALADADLVVSCTGATGYVVSAEAVAEATASDRTDRPMHLLDLALPRDIDPAVLGLPGVTVIDLDDLGDLLRDEDRSAEVDEAQAIVDEEVEAYIASQRSAQVAPVVVALRSRAADVVAAELARLDARLPDLPEDDRAEIAHALRRAVDKLLHAPTVRIKELAAETDGRDYAQALHVLFDLDPDAVESVSRPESRS